MNEILQKVKGVSGGQNAAGQMEDDSSTFVSDAEELQVNNNEFELSSATVDVPSESTSIDTINNPLAKSTFHPVHINGVHSTPHGLHSESANNGDEVHVLPSTHLRTVEQESTDTLSSSRSSNLEHEKETVSYQYSEESSVIEEYDVNGTDQVTSEAANLPDTEATVVR